MEAAMVRYTHFKETLNTKGEVIPLEDVHNKLINKDSDYYTNLFWGDEDLLKYFNEHGSIKSYHGKVVSDKLIFDFDSEDNIDIARQDARKVINKIGKHTGNKRIEEYITIYFSGNKGFHVEVATDQEFTPDEAKSICEYFAEGCESFDTVIYSFVRAFRLPNTKHNKSGLFKIPLTPKQLVTLSVEEIKSLAINPATEIPSVTPIEGVDFKKVIPKKPSFKPVIVNDVGHDGIRGLDNIDFSKCPKHTPRCFYALLKGVMEPGERSRVFFKLAAYLRNEGMSKDVAYNTLKGVARENNKLYPNDKPIDKDEIWNQHIASVYNSPEWKQIPGASGTTEDNELIKRYCDAIKSDRKCCMHSKSSSGGGLVKIEEVSNSFQEFAENFDANIVKTGLSDLDNHMQIVAGTTTLLVGGAGVGKTTTILNILELANANDQHAIFFSMDMHKHLVYQKLGVKCTNYTQKQIKEFYKNRDSEKIKEIRDAIAQRYDKTIFDFTATATFEELRDKVFAAEQMIGNKIKLVIVDYASRLSGPHSDRFANAGYNAIKSTEVAADTNAAWILLCQISRQTGDGSTPLRSKRAAKESGDWEETASNVITMWRPFLGKGDIHQDNIIKFYLAKNRMGEEVEFAVMWDGARGTIKDWNEIDSGESAEDLKKIERDALWTNKKKKD